MSPAPGEGTKRPDPKSAADTKDSRSSPTRAKPTMAKANPSGERARNAASAAGAKASKTAAAADAKAVDAKAADAKAVDAKAADVTTADAKAVDARAADVTTADGKTRRAAVTTAFEFVCSQCGARVPADVSVTACAICAAPLSPVLPAYDRAAVRAEERGLWRYADLLPVTLDKKHSAITLGEGGTPLVPMSIVGLKVDLKLEFLQPTGSYKDRGAAVLATALARRGPRVVVEDSSGNAGASMAAYLARANIGLQLFVPAGAASGALRQAVAYGADVDQSAASREEAAAKARAAVSKTQDYASHVHCPHFMAGVATMAYELFEALGGAPDNLVLPVGQGVLALGLYYGFETLKRAGLVKRVPRMFGVQARACAPVFDAFNRGADTTQPVAGRPTDARGVAVADPARGAELIGAFRAVDGALLAVSEVEIRRAQALMARAGWFIEPTAAVAVAGVVKLDKLIGARETTVVPLTGSGLKVA